MHLTLMHSCFHVHAVFRIGRNNSLVSLPWGLGWFFAAQMMAAECSHICGESGISQREAQTLEGGVRQSIIW